MFQAKNDFHEAGDTACALTMSKARLEPSNKDGSCFAPERLRDGFDFDGVSDFCTSSVCLLSHMLPLELMQQSSRTYLYIHSVLRT
jgi:hypothetical protein